MANVQHKRRTSAGPPPDGSLLPGQIAVGDVDEAIHYGRTNGSVITIKSGSGGGGGGSTPTTFELQNRDTIQLRPGMVVKLYPTGVGVVRWNGSGVYAGVVVEAADPGFNAIIQAHGPLELGDWSQVTESNTSDLSIGSVWADNASPGKIRFTIPATGTVQCIGYTAGPKILILSQQSPITRAE